MIKVFFAIFFAVLIPSLLGAHPHVRLEARLEFEFADDGCGGFWQEWTFDPFFSATLINDFDANRNGTFEAAEIRAIQNGAFANLKNYGFFTLVRKGEKRVSPAKVEGFSAETRDKRVVYRFRVPLDATLYGRDFHVAVFDTTYYCETVYAQEAVSFPWLTEGSAGVSWSREVNKKYPVYYNPAGAANDFTAYTTWKPGLQTVYPEEIHVTPSR